MSHGLETGESFLSQLQPSLHTALYFHCYPSALRVETSQQDFKISAGLQHFLRSDTSFLGELGHNIEEDKSSTVEHTSALSSSRFTSVPI
jgi:hypothetical protein